MWSSEEGVMSGAGDLPDPTVVGRLREGMDVRTSDGEVIGTVVRLWEGTDPAQRELRHAIQDRGETYD